MKLSHFSESKFYFSAIVFIFILLLLGTVQESKAQEIDVSKCSDSEEKAKECVKALIETLKASKSANQDLVGLLKAENKQTDELKNQYETARKKVKVLARLITRKKPNFNNIKIQFNSSTESANTFSKNANIALTGGQGTGLGFLDGLIDWFLDNACKIISNEPAKIGCKTLAKYIKTFKIKKSVRWKKWKKIKPLTD